MQMYQNIILILLLALSNNVASQSFKVICEVINSESKQPLNKVAVNFFVSDIKILETKTDAEGRVSFTISDIQDTYITFEKSGFKSAKQEIVNDAAIQGFFIELTPKTSSGASRTINLPPAAPANVKTSTKVIVNTGGYDTEPPDVRDFNAILTGTVKNKNDGRPIPNTEINIENKDANIVEKIISNSEGNYEFKIDPKNNYGIKSTADYYLAKRSEIEACDDDDTQMCLNGFSSVRFLEKLPNGDQKFYTELELDDATINKIINLGSISYETDKAIPNADGRAILDNAYEICKDNEGIVFEIGSHTDSRGSDDYNLQLSERRAQYAQRVIINRGIPQIRLASKGYGETSLRNHCYDNIKCSEDEHAENRRTVLKVIGFMY